MTGGWRVGGRRSCRPQVPGKPGGSNDVDLLADIDLSAETISATAALPLGGGGARSSRARIVD